MKDCNDRDFDLLLRAAVNNEATDNKEARELDALEGVGVTFSRRYERRKRAILREVRRGHGYGCRYANRKTRFLPRLALVALLVLLAMLAGAAITISAVKNRQWHIAMETENACFVIRFVSDDSPDGIEWNAAPTSIRKSRAPTALPAGWEREEVSRTASGVCLRYTAEDGFGVTYRQCCMSVPVYVDSRSAVSTVCVNDADATLFTESDGEKHRYTLIWTDHEYYYYLYSTTLNLQSLVALAESVN